MPRCCVVSGCRNKQGTEPGGISLHAIPPDECRARQWCEALGIEHIKTVKTVICSEHFEPDAFYDISGRRRLLKNAVPSSCARKSLIEHVKEENLSRTQIATPKRPYQNSGIRSKPVLTLEVNNLIESEHDAIDNKNDIKHEDMDFSDFDDEDNLTLESLQFKNKTQLEIQPQKSTSLKVCRSCLETDCELHTIPGELVTVYGKLTDASTHADLPMSLCVKCTATLAQCNEFRERTRLACRMLDDMLKEGGGININKIRQIDRQKLMRNYKATLFCAVNLNVDSDIENKVHEKTTDVGNKVEGSKTDDNKMESTKSIKAEILANTDEESNSGKSDILNFDTDNSTIDENVFEKPIKPEIGKTMREPKAKTSSDKSKPKVNKSVKAKSKAKVKREPGANKALIKNKEDDEIFNQYFTYEDFNTVEEQRRELEKRKETVSYKDSPFKCENCFRGFQDEGLFKNHRHRYDESRGAHACEVCHLRHAHYYEITAHKQICHRRRYSCNSCKFTSFDRRTSTKHIEWHEGKTYKCNEYDCGQEFKGRSTFMYHRRVAHPLDQVCGYCGYCFINEMGLTLHQRRIHNVARGQQFPEGGPSCDQCNVRFVSKEALQKHLRVSFKHNRSERNERVVLQLTKKGKDTTTVCKECGLKSRTGYHHRHHVRRAHPHLSQRAPPLGRSDCLCDVCGKYFKCQATLKDHMHVHDAHKSFGCDVCAKTFQTAANLKLHKKRHLGRLYPCAQCGRQFSDKSNRNRHEQLTHSDAVTETSCQYCRKSFKYVSALRLHIKHVHLKEPWPKRARNKPARRAFEDTTTD